VPKILENLHPINITSDKSEPVFPAPVDELWFKESDTEEEKECVKKAHATDLAFILSRQDSDTKSFWTVFNQNTSSKEMAQTTVGYLPIILAPAHRFETLNAVVRRCLHISKQFGQQYTVLTVDQALYCKKG